VVLDDKKVSSFEDEAKDHIHPRLNAGEILQRLPSSTKMDGQMKVSKREIKWVIKQLGRGIIYL